ncbi:MAG: FAD:protein FMN transferase [Halioglobus sp.]
MMHRKRINCFGSSCQLAINAIPSEADQLVDIAIGEFSRLEAKFSAYHAQSLISRINQSAGTGSFTPLDPEARSLFDFVSALWQESSHLFDPTTRLLQNCYDDNGQLKATEPQIKAMLNLVGWAKLEISDKGALLPHKGMLLDLNSCIRPYAIDSVRKRLTKEGVESAMIEMAQDAATIGKQADGANWLLGLRHPLGSRTAINRIKLNGKGFAMRGDFERRTLLNNEIFGRGLSPVDGYPIPGMLSVSVVADSCLDACGAASIARLKTEKAAIHWLENLGIPWMAIDRELRCHGPLAPG